MSHSPAENLQFQSLAPGLGAGSPAPAGWQPLAALPLVVMVGVTGVGKSTTLDALSRTGVDFRPLPDRRVLTDTLIIEAMQAADGLPSTPVTDRRLRFDYTRRFREQYSGGMAHALTLLYVDPTSDPRLLLFDGLRGENEVYYALATLPAARFVLLDAPDAVRVARLLGRNDAFDHMAVRDSDSDLQTDELLNYAAGIFDGSARSALLSLVTSGAVTADALRAKVQIVAEERRHYDPETARRLLKDAGPGRALVVDTALIPPHAVAHQISEQLAAWGLRQPSGY